MFDIYPAYQGDRCHDGHFSPGHSGDICHFRHISLIRYQDTLPYGTPKMAQWRIMIDSSKIQAATFSIFLIPLSPYCVKIFLGSVFILNVLNKARFNALYFLYTPPNFVVRSLEPPRSQDLQIKKPIVGR